MFQEIAQLSHTLTETLDRSFIQTTPLEWNQSLSERYQADIYLKREDLQHVRSFKIRGAFTKIMSLTDEEKQHGVVAASAWNHAQGVALTCAQLGINGTIFMPQTTPAQKVRKTKKFGNGRIEVQLVGDIFNDAYEAAKAYGEKTGATFIHPFNDHHVIAGQGTLWVEILEQMQWKPIDMAMIAVWWWGLISWVWSVLKDHNWSIQIIGVESIWSASMTASLRAGEPQDIGKVTTFADGVAVKKPWKLTFEIAQQVVDQMKVIDDGQTATAMLELLDDQWIITEPAGALSIAALESMKDEICGKSVVCIVCGWNFDFSRLEGVEEKSLKWLWLKRYFIITFPQRPWALREFLRTLWADDDIVRFEYMKKSSKEYGPALVGIQSSHPWNFVSLRERMQEHAISFEDITESQLYFDLLV